MENTTIDTGVNTGTSPTQETSTEPAKAETPAKPVVKESTDRVIPYSRFKEVNEAKRALEDRIKELESKQNNSHVNLKQQGDISSEKGAEDEIDLDSMSPKELIEYAKEKAKQEAKNEVLKELDAKKEAERKAMEQIESKLDFFKEMGLEFDETELLMLADDKTDGDLDKAMLLLQKTKKEAQAAKSQSQSQSEQPKETVPQNTDLGVSKRNPEAPSGTNINVDYGKDSFSMIAHKYVQGLMGKR